MAWKAPSFMRCSGYYSPVAIELRGWALWEWREEGNRIKASKLQKLADKYEKKYVKRYGIYANRPPQFVVPTPPTTFPWEADE